MTTTKQAEPGLQLLNPAQPGQQDPTAPQQAPVFNDIQPPVDIPEPVPYLLYGSIGIAALILAAALFFWWKKSKKSQAPEIPPGILARNDLMQARELMTEETTLHYLDRVSGILRTYIETRFRLLSTRKTTREFFAFVSRQSEKHALAPFRQDLQQCLECCDRAKFAHQSAGIAQLEEMETTLLHFINTTSEEPEKAEA